MEETLSVDTDTDTKPEETVSDNNPTPQVGTAAPVGKTTTKTKGGWFEGTTWG